MGTTKTKVMSRAAIECKHQAILTETQNDEAGRVFRSLYDDVVTFCLEEDDWSFCLKRVSSTGSATTEAVPYAYEHELPGDFIRLQRVREENYATGAMPLDYDKAESKLYTKDETIEYAYVSAVRGENTAYWPAAFGELVAMTLAEWGAGTLGVSQARRDDIKRARRSALHNAISQDRAQRAPRKPPLGSWVRAHIGSYRYLRNS